jgi:hypothetical protein
MRRAFCATALAGLVLLCISQSAASQVTASSSGFGATASIPETVAETAGPAIEAVLPSHRVVGPVTMCATRVLFAEYAFWSKFPEGVACERLEPGVLLLWSGQREPTRLEGLLSVAKVTAHGGVGFTFAASLELILGSRLRPPSLGAIGSDTGYERVLGSNHFGRNITPSAASSQLSALRAGD